MSVSRDEVCQRIKRLMDLFPNYIHNIDVYSDSDGLQKDLLLLGINTEQTTEDHVGIEIHLIYKPETFVGTVHYSSRELEYERFMTSFLVGDGDISWTPLVYIEPSHPEIHKLSFDDPNLSPLQAKIFEAVYGPEWPKFVHVTMEKTMRVTVNCEVKKKLK